MMEGARTLAVATLLVATPLGCQEVHPTKQIYTDWESWPVTTPTEIDFSARFQPFRAVWSREYRNMDGEMRTDRVVLVAEELSWYGRPVLSLTYHDAGAPDFPDTNARTTAVYVDAKTLSLVRATAPRAGTAEDYNVVAATDGGVVTTSVSAATGATETTEFAADEPVFGAFNLDFLIWAALPLQTEARALVHLYSPGANALTPSLIRVLDREEIELPQGERAEAWVVERPILQPDNARMHHFRLLDRPPFLVSRHVIDLDTGETSFHLSLLEWELLGGG